MGFAHRQPEHIRMESMIARLWARAYGLATLVHLTLPDFEQEDWAVPRAIAFIGALILLRRPHPLGFLMCVVGAAIPLLFLRDVLTQSMYLLWVGMLGMAVSIRPSISILGPVRVITAMTYGLAALHKLNTDFLNPEYSCAQHAARQVAIRWPVFDGIDQVGLALPLVVIAVECALMVGILRSRPWVWLLGIAFHLPLTATLAPAFGAVMLSGYICCLTPRHLVWARRAWRSHRPSIVGFTLGTFFCFILYDGGLSFWWTELKLALAMGLALGVILTIPGWGVVRSSAAPSALSVVVGVLWLIHGLTPYVGLQYQHASAMLSNLRIDSGCHNSLVFPESLVMEDPYVRINEARIGHGQRKARERIIESTLWNLSALHSMRRNWCIEELRPITFRGVWKGTAFSVSDLCASDWAESQPPLKATFSGFQRFQKNLPRSCPAACIH